jgi:hypothetical protein
MAPQSGGAFATVNTVRAPVEELCIGPGGEETWKKRNDKQATWF